jgi:ataxin-10
VEHKEEWIEWFLFKVCVEEQKLETLFTALCSTDVECSDSGEYSAKHAFVLGTLSKYLTEHPKEVAVPDSFALELFMVHKNAVDIVDFTCRGSSPLPTGSPAIDVLGYSLQLLLKYLGDLEPPSTIRKSMAKAQGERQPSLASKHVSNR